jgi:hypothetical protein
LRADESPAVPREQATRRDPEAGPRDVPGLPREPGRTGIEAAANDPEPSSRTHHSDLASHGLRVGSQGSGRRAGNRKIQGAGVASRVMVLGIKRYAFRTRIQVIFAESAVHEERCWG